MNRKILVGSAACLGMLILILDGKSAMAGAAEGLQLCIQAVIPSLFPFFFLTGLLTASLMGEKLKPLLPLGKWLGFPNGTESIMLCAFLGGYPSGAQTVAQAWKNGHLNKESAIHLIRFCNNAGPSFLFGMLLNAFPDVKAVWALWATQLLSAFLTGKLFPVSHGCGVQMQSRSVSVAQALNSSIRGTVLVCGWVILFRVVLTFLDRWFLWMISPQLRIVILGLLEITNGCMELGQVGDLRLRFLICSGILCCGGLCVSMQTVCVIDGLPIRQYFLGKLLQCILCMALSIAAAYGYRWILLPVGSLYWIVYKKLRKIYSNSHAHTV